ncbi:MerR family transcriptional regulator [Deinococcus taeanensis]|uniref:MerR family transcriptional regulator n=1 Tax=Deinococcus taeanensis TaxID=2737050 RepID=UPI001CDD16BD|nr:MerR family transcriptional regulator [Deinococcus taeanensis]UBV43904.1 MerR family transcriptional regulator [Deinococcus taeanensis]
MADPPTALTIQDAALRLGVSPHTLRYYDREGLLSVPRTGSGERRYSDVELRFLTFLIYLRGTGMPMAGLRDYAALFRQGDASIPQRRVLLVAHERHVARQLEDMKRALEAIRNKIARYDELRCSGQAPSPERAAASAPEYA